MFNADTASLAFRDDWLIEVILAASCDAIARPAASSEAELILFPEASCANILLKEVLEDESPEIAAEES